MKILLVDDEQYFVSALAERLTMRGIPSDWASSGDEALDKARSQAYDLAILDVKMPNVSGIELRRRLEAIKPDMRFIFFTGHGSEEDFAQCSEQGDSYLVKPLAIDQIIEKIHATMLGLQE